MTDIRLYRQGPIDQITKTFRVETLTEFGRDFYRTDMLGDILTAEQVKVFGETARKCGLKLGWHIDRA